MHFQKQFVIHVSVCPRRVQRNTLHVRKIKLEIIKRNETFQAELSEELTIA